MYVVTLVRLEIRNMCAFDIIPWFVLSIRARTHTLFLKSISWQRDNRRYTWVRRHRFSSPLPAI